MDLDGGTLTVVRQLATATLTADGTAQFGPPKTGRARIIDLGAETVALLREHKRQQAELKMKNRLAYRDHQLVFAKEPAELFRADARLGDPLAMTRIGGGAFARLLKTANVRRITLHGLRHTSATLLLLAGEPIKVVSERLGHSASSFTMDIYQHVLPSMGRRAADRLATLLHG